MRTVTYARPSFVIGLLGFVGLVACQTDSQAALRPSAAEFAPTAPPTSRVSLNLVVDGLTNGSPLVLSINGALTKLVTSNGAYALLTQAPFGLAYSVSITTQPPGHICTLTHGGGILGASTIPVAVRCVLAVSLANDLEANGSLGQPTTHSGAAGVTGAGSLNAPQGKTYTSPQGTLYVADTGNNRVLGYLAPADLTGAQATLVLGQSNVFGASAAGLAADLLNGPTSVSGEAHKMVVTDRGNHRVLVYNSPPAGHVAADVVVGQRDFVTGAAGCDANSLSSPSSAIIVGGTLIVADTGNNRVLMWTDTPTAHAIQPNLVLGQGDYVSCAVNGGGAAGASTLNAPQDVWSDGNMLFVADTGNHRVLGWRYVPIIPGEFADFVVGQSSMTATALPATGSGTVATPASVVFDSTTLYVADVGASRVVAFRPVPYSNGSAARFTLGQTSFTNGTCNQGGLVGADALCSPQGVSFSSGALVVADTGNNRMQVYESDPNAAARALGYFLVSVSPAPFASGPTNVATAGRPAYIGVTALNIDDSTNTAYRGTVVPTPTDPNAVLEPNYTFNANDAGKAVLTAEFFTAGSQVVTVTDVSRAKMMGVHAITVFPGDANHIVVSGFPNPVASGTPGSVTLTVMDNWNNIVTNYTGTVRVTSNDGNATLPTPITFTAGNAGSVTTSVTLAQVGTNRITATDANDSALTGSQVGIVTTGAAGPAVTFEFTGYTNPIAGVPVAITVTALDASNNVAAGYLGMVHFTSTDGRAVMPADTNYMQSNQGRATVNVTFGTSGNQVLTATDFNDTSISGNSNVIVVHGGNAVALQVLSYPSPVTAGQNANVTVRAVDRYGNPSYSYTDLVNLSVSDTAAAVQPNYTFAASDHGSASIAVVFETAGTWSISASDPNTAGMAAQQNNIVVNGGAIASFEVINYPSPVTAGVSWPVSVSARDSYGNVASSYNGTAVVACTDPNAVTPGSVNFTNGLPNATVAVSMLQTGTYAITANDYFTPAIAGRQGSILVKAAAAAQYTLTGFPPTVTAGQAANVTITVYDVYHNIVPGYTGTAHIRSTDPNAVRPADFTFASGNAGAANVTVALQTAGTFTISANDTVTASIAGNQNGIVVSAANANYLMAKGFANPTVAGVAGNITVTAYDVYGNIATGYTGTIATSSADPNAVKPGNYTFSSGDSGVHALPVTLKTVGNQNITVTDTGTATLTAVQPNIVVTPGPAASYYVAGYPTTVTAGQNANLNFVAYDAYNNIATGYTGTLHVTSSDGNAGLPLDVTYKTANAGNVTVAVTLKTAGTQAVNGNDYNTPGISGRQGGITVNPNVAYRVSLSGYPATINAGQAAPVTLTALDAYSNVATGYTGTLNLASDDTAATYPASTGFTAPNAGVKAVSLTFATSGNHALTANDSVTPRVAGKMPWTFVNATSATHLVVQNFPAQVTAGQQANVTVLALDAYNNINPNYTGTIQLSSTDPNAVLPGLRTFGPGDQGNVAMPVTLIRVGARAISANDTGTPAISGAQTGIIVNPNVAVSLSATGFPTYINAGSPNAMTVTALDAYSNIATGYSGIVRLSSSDAAAVLSANTTLYQGTGSLPVTLMTTGIQWINANDMVTTTLAARESGIVVNANTVAYITATGFNATPTACTSSNITVRAYDSFGNINPNYIATVTLTSTDPNALLPAPASFTSGNAGVRPLAVTLKTAGNWNITAADNNGLTAAQNGIAVAAGSPQVVVLSMPSTVRPTQMFGGTVAVTDNCNNVATGYTGTIDLISSDPNGTPSNTTPLAMSFTAPNAGVQTVSGLKLTTVASPQVLYAQDSGSPGTIYGNANINVVAQLFYAEWDLTSSNVGNYSYNATKIDFTPGYAELTPQLTLAGDYNSTAFGAAASSTNVRWDTGVSALVLGNITTAQPGGYLNGAEYTDPNFYSSVVATSSGTFKLPNGTGSPNFNAFYNYSANGMYGFAGVGVYCLQGNATVSGANYLYMKAFDLTNANIVISASSQLSYAVFPNDATSPNVKAGNSNYVALNLVFTDGTETRNLSLTDSSGHTFTPNGQGATLVSQAWNIVQVNLSSLAGKKLKRIDAGWQRTAAPTGGFRAWFDEVQINGVVDYAQTNNAELASDWTPQYANVVGYWKFNGFGLVANNTTISGTVGSSITASNADGLGMRYVQGHLNQGIYTDGVDDVLTINSAQLPAGAQMTFAAWARPSEAPTLGGYCARMFQFGLDNPAHYFINFIPLCSAGGYTSYTGRFYSEVGSTGADLGTPTYVMGLDHWMHIAATVDSANNANLYIDGQMVSNGTTGAALTSLTGAYNYLNGGPFGSARGYLDDVAVWSSVLNANEVRVLYDRQSAAANGTLTSHAFVSPYQAAGTGTMSWVTSAPSYKPLASDNVSETATSYSSLPNSTLESGLEELWHFDEAALGTVYGGDFYDDTGHGNTAWQSGGFVSGGMLTANMPGEFGASVSLNGNVISTSTAFNTGPDVFTLSVWFNTPFAGGGGKLLGFGGSQTGNSGSYDRQIWIHSDGTLHFGVYDGSQRTINSMGSFNDGRWHHVAAVCMNTSSILYVDGKAQNSMTHGTPVAYSGWWRIGGDNIGTWTPAGGAIFYGRLDEIGIWGRPLAASEVFQLYRRGATRYKYRVRACANSACSDNQAWMGPDGTYETYFSESLNVSGATKLAGRPVLNLANYAPGFSISTASPYIQYQAVLESDDVAAQCIYNSMNAPCSPENSNIIFARNNYDASLPTITNTSTVSLNTLNSFSGTAGQPGCPDGLSFTLSPTGATYYYYAAGTYHVSNGTVAQTNTAAQLTPTAMTWFGSQFGVGQTYFRAYLNSAGVNPCTLESVVMTGTQ